MHADNAGIARDRIPRLQSIETSLNQSLIKPIAGNAGFKPKLDGLSQRFHSSLLGFRLGHHVKRGAPS